MRPAWLDPLTDPRWTAFVGSAEASSVFHHPAWLALVADRYRYGMSALCVLSADGEIAAGVPLARVYSRLTGKRLVALPFSDCCPPAFAAGAGTEEAAALTAGLVAERARTRLDVEVRWHLDAAPASAHVVDGMLAHRLRLDAGAESVLARASKSQVRRGIAKAQREGVVAAPTADRRGLAEFYELHLQTRRRQAVPTQPKDFIMGFEALFARGLGHVMVARHEGRAIAAAVFLTHRGTLTYKYGASDERFLGLRPNHALFAEAIRRGCDAGMHELDFGRTDPANEGLSRFKRSWGAEETPLAYTFLADRPPKDGHGVAGRLVEEAIRRGPPATSRMIGTALYRHVG